MGPPLKIVNAFFFQNLVEPHAGGVLHEHFIDDCMVFSPQMIDQCLEFNIPEKLRNDTRRLKVWKSNVSRLQTYYNNYCSYVCEGKMKWVNHVKKWEAFKNNLGGGYCIHH